MIISPERWGVNKLSKHNYALALAEKGNAVYFLNPPVSGLNEIKTSSESGILLIDYSIRFRGTNRIQKIFPTFANVINQLEINRILKAIGPIDIVWSFDSYRFQNLNLFGTVFKIFHPVDITPGYLNLQAAATAHVVLSVSNLILDRFRSTGTPSYFINHGLSQPFINSESPSTWLPGNPIKCGYIGNLLSFALHDENLYKIVHDNPTVEFHFIGPIQSSNLGEYTSKNLIDKLRVLTNVIFHGEKSPAEIAPLINGFDLFLICYHPEKVGKDLSSNSHKILEYLSTGKTVVSSYISTYASFPADLIEMVEHSSELPDRFSQSVHFLEKLNISQRQLARKKFASQNSYPNHIATIEKIITEIGH